MFMAKHKRHPLHVLLKAVYSERRELVGQTFPQHTGLAGRRLASLPAVQDGSGKSSYARMNADAVCPASSLYIEKGGKYMLQLARMPPV